MTPPGPTFEIRANATVPHAKVVEVVDALKAAGATDVSFQQAQVGEGGAKPLTK